ncbi:hypothetical protein Nos7524_5653 (plasmid) [Nostoc sp. PCC 7524]|uniref:hypothetical protein n=1 Tax=Nostoc sp. (strain ATCC 29411 / PCC 7524) TaxID=28072 RepID=UPI00029EFC01|nr:hypothetical protein [Nostoc sp. PCC 7524]AFY51343.1 hypothetical protein Nos7524_5653 [Nostoc sp. PCC 7524]
MEERISQIIENIQLLAQLRQQLLKKPLAPPGTWIHEYEVVRYYRSGNREIYRYAKWQADNPIFKRNPKPKGHPPKKGKDPEFTCHQHIGRVGSTTGLGADPETEAAYEEWENRKQLESIEECLNQIELLLAKVMPKNK